jgi:hypothetical protein
MSVVNGGLARRSGFPCAVGHGVVALQCLLSRVQVVGRGVGGSCLSHELNAELSNEECGE